MTAKPRILICDDDSKLRVQWQDKVRECVGAGFNVSVLESDEFRRSLGVLEKRRKAARDGQQIPESTSFDDARLLIVDYDLIGLESGGYLTAEIVAYLVRGFSSCSYVVVVNQFGRNSFDLSLAGDLESFADINIGDAQLDNPALWGVPERGYRPWSWVDLLDAAQRLESCARDLLEKLDEPITTYLGLTKENVGYLPRDVASFLGTGKKIDEVTFRDFVQESGGGLRSKDRAVDDRACARIAASRLGKWLTRQVVPGQALLVDAPHLVSRYPSLLANPGDPTGWNQTTNRSVSRLGMRYRRLQEFAFARREWCDRPLWYWPRLVDSEKGDELRQKIPEGLPDIVFCEDVSEFLPRSESREFVADVPSPFVRRFVSRPDAATLPTAARKDLSRVQYEPSVRFSL